MTNLRCAVYGRVSSDRQNPLSIDDQIHKCKEHAVRNHWTVLAQHIYRDEAISGTTDNRPGLQLLLASLIVLIVVAQRSLPGTSGLRKNPQDPLC